MKSAQRTLHLHIGKNKAGSTAIQRQLSILHKRYARLGPLRRLARPDVLPVKAFGLPNAVLLAAAVSGTSGYDYFVRKRQKFSDDALSDLRSTLWERVSQEVDAAPTSRFVASSEFLFAFLEPADIRDLSDKLQGIFDTVQIVVYLRDQHSDLPAVWAQTVKGPSRSGKSFSEFMAEMGDTPFRWDYARILKGWLEVFGRDALSVAMFDTNALKDGDVVADFCDKAGLPAPAHPGSKTVKNATPQWDELEALRRRNLGLQAQPDTDSVAHSDPTAEIAAYRAQITQMVSPGNAWVNDTFLRDHPVRLPVA